MLRIGTRPLINRSMTTIVNGLWQQQFDSRTEYWRRALSVLHFISLIEACLLQLNIFPFSFFSSSYIPSPSPILIFTAPLLPLSFYFIILYSFSFTSLSFLPPRVLFLSFTSSPYSTSFNFCVCPIPPPISQGSLPP